MGHLLSLWQLQLLEKTLISMIHLLLIMNNKICLNKYNLIQQILI